MMKDSLDEFELTDPLEPIARKYAKGEATREPVETAQVVLTRSIQAAIKEDESL